MNTILKLLAAFVVSLHMLSCSQDPEALEHKHPLVLKAQALRDGGEYAKAAEFYEDYLRIQPNSTRIHLQLASICNDNIDDPLRAILHYRRYLELAQASEDSEAVTAWKDAAEKKFYEKNRERFELLSAPVPGDDEKVKKCLAYIKKLSEENAALKAEITEMKNAATEKELVASSETPPVPAETPSPALPPPAPLPLLSAANPPATLAKTTVPQAQAPAPAEMPAASKSKVRAEYYTVKANDSLVKISKEIYGTSKHAELIFEANRNILSSPDRLDVGQRLRIPLLPGE
ncbi:MAG: hypothetical protein A2X49_08195 [Lentisphaerae bacterium GWF2_52_8]|nr:MAG: hypothetical protein A2X49_08195 [Lentisphaerae bacterium GWF2_52_8]